MQDPGCAALAQPEFGMFGHADQLHPMQRRFSSAGSAVTVSAHSSSAVGAYAQQALGQACAVEIESREVMSRGQHICRSGSKPLDLPEQPQSQEQCWVENVHSCCHHAPSSIVTATTHSSSEAGMVVEEALRSWRLQSPPSAPFGVTAVSELEMPVTAVDLPSHTFVSGHQITEPPGQEPPLQSKDHVDSVVSSSHAAEHQENRMASGSETPAQQSASASSLTTRCGTAHCEPAKRWMARTLLEEAAAAIIPRKLAPRTTSICSSLASSSGSSAFRHRAAKDLALEFSDAVMADPMPPSVRPPRRRSCAAAVSSQPVWGA